MQFNNLQLSVSEHLIRVA